MSYVKKEMNIHCIQKFLYIRNIRNIEWKGYIFTKKDIAKIK